MRELVIEWRHYDKEGATCDRCSTTGTSVKEVVAGITGELAGKGITVTFSEIKLPEELMAESNLILLNGVPLEEILGAAADENHCPSCSCLTGSDTSCRTVEYEGESYEEIPVALIRKAAYKALGLSGA
jgi:hypothetical protein